MASRNKLHAAILKAEMRGDSDLVANLKKQVAEQEAASAATKPTSSLSLSERNKLHARILKAELLGDAALVQQLKSKLSEAESAPGDDRDSEARQSSPKRETVRTLHVAKRVAEEDLSVKQLARKEKTISALKDSIMFVSSAVKAMDKRQFNPDDEYDIELKEKKHKSDVVISAQREDSEDQCAECLLKHARELVLSIGKKVFLTLGRNEPLLDGHCFIRSISHCDTSVVAADEDTICEINRLKNQLVQMYAQLGKSVVFSEILKPKSKKYDKHLVIECFPIRGSQIPEAKMFFKKSIMECETEWSMNKKLVEIDGKEVSRVIPKTLPYFWVTFGEGNSGYAHVIEDEDAFATFFAAEVIGGMLDIEARRWRKPRSNFHRNKSEVLQLKAEWKTFDPFSS